MIESWVVTAPANWASALVNGDDSGLFGNHPDPADIRDYHVFLDMLRRERISVVSCEGEPYYTSHGKLHQSGYQGVQVLDYVVCKESHNDQNPG